jgi:hypothetical protein
MTRKQEGFILTKIRHLIVLIIGFIFAILHTSLRTFTFRKSLLLYGFVRIFLCAYTAIQKVYFLWVLIPPTCSQMEDLENGACR